MLQGAVQGAAQKAAGHAQAESQSASQVQQPLQEQLSTNPAKDVVSTINPVYIGTVLALLVLLWFLFNK